jgi:hypothetical protein
LSDTEREIPAEYVPTADQRALVENAAAFGLTQADRRREAREAEKEGEGETKKPFIAAAGSAR